MEEVWVPLNDLILASTARAVHRRSRLKIGDQRLREKAKATAKAMAEAGLL